MPQPKKSYEEVRIPFAKMSYTPDVPSTALGPNEYNSGLNVETDVRGIRSVAGDQEFLDTIPGTPTYVSAGFRQPQPGKDNSYYFVAATTEGYWYATNGLSAWQDITPGAGPFTTYGQATNITEAWNGTVPFYNDEANPPMFWPEFSGVSLKTTAASSAAGTTTITFDNQTDELTGVAITSHTGDFSYTNGAVLKVNQKVTISGTNTNTTTKQLTNVDIVGNAGRISFDNPSFASFVGTIDDGTAPGAGTVLTVTSVTSGFIEVGMALSASSLTANTTITAFVSGTNGGVGVYTVNNSQERLSQAFQGYEQFNLVEGQSVTVAGTITNTDTTLSNVKIVNSGGDFTCDSTTIIAGQSVEISGTITNTDTTLSSVFITGLEGTFSSAASTFTVGQTVNVSGSVSATPQTLSGVVIAGSGGEFSCAASTLSIGQTVIVSGTNTNTTVTALAGVAITGTAGQFSCTASTLTAGQVVKISGTLGGTGTITGYVDPSLYVISTTNGTTTFTLTELDGTALVTTAGTPTGLTYEVQAPLINGYTNPTTYVISATNTTTTFTLTELNGTPLLTFGGTTPGLTFQTQIASAVGYTSPKDYIISATNGTTTFTLVETNGAPLSTTGGSLAGITVKVLAPAITGYTNPTTYLIGSTNGTTSFTLITQSGQSITTQAGTPTGITVKILKPSITGYTNPTTYYLSIANGQYSLVDGAGDALVTTGGRPTGITFTVLAPSVANGTYFITYTDGVSAFRLSATQNGAGIATNAGTPVGLTFIYTPFAIGQTILVEGIVPVGFRGSYTVTGVTQSSVSFAGSTVGPQTVYGSVSDPYPQMIMYSNKFPLTIDTIAYASPTTQTITLATAQPTAPYSQGDLIIISGINNFYNGVFTVTSSTTTTITYLAVPGAAFPDASAGQGEVAPKYSWNFNPNWSSVYAKFMRMYNTPNVGSILVAGGLTATDLDGTVLQFPVTVQWSQAFGLNEAPLTWQPTVVNIANQLEVPLRGEALDGFPCNGQFFLCSYWDTVVFSPINYSTTSAPILGVRLFNQGRGLLSSNCWGNTDKMVYGIDARDIWVFDGQTFQGIGNQRVKNWFYDQLDPEYYNRVFMQVNTQKNQVEIYYPDSEAVGGVPNKMLAYRYDLEIWNAPREVTSATFACESPIYTYNAAKVRWDPNLGSREVVYARGELNEKLVQKDYGYSFLDNAPIASSFRRDNIKLLPDYSGKLMVHRILPEAVNMGAIPFTSTDEIVIIPSTGSITVKVEGAQSVGQTPVSRVVGGVATMTLNTDNPWIQMDQNAYRVNYIEISNSSNTNIWMCSAATWQFTQVEDDR